MSAILLVVSVLITGLPLGLGPAAVEVVAAAPPKLEAGFANTCAVLASGQVFCWGHNLSNANDPPPGLEASAVSTGQYHTCAVRKIDSEVICWGNNRDGQASPPAGLQSREVSASDAFTCALDAQNKNEVVCWGGGYSQYGNQFPPTGLQASQLTTGQFHACVVAALNGLVVCWGDNRLGQLTPPIPDFTASQVSAGARHTCAIDKRNERVVCWGDNSSGQATPPAGLRAKEISSGVFHTCAIASNSEEVVCWGLNTQGQTTPPAKLMASQLTSGGNHNCASRKGDRVTICWGWNDYGQAPQPSLPTLPLQLGSVGDNLAISLPSLTDSPMPGNKATYDQVGVLIPGLKVEKYGAIGGRPLAHGNYSLTVAATDALNFQARQTYNVTVLAIIVFPFVQPSPTFTPTPCVSNSTRHCVNTY
jgi:hypothetical protein